MEFKKIIKWGIILLILIAIVLLGKNAMLGQYLNLEYIKGQQVVFQSYYNENPLVIGFVFFIMYIVVTAISIPGAWVLSLAAGAIFGFTKGLIIVSFASTIGATCAFLISRYLLKDFLEKKYPRPTQIINENIDREGAFYLFGLRVVPLFPFFLINLLMGLTSIPVWTYFWVSQLGMLPVTAAYINAGKEIVNIKSTKDILSPTFIIALVILGILPIAGKWGIKFIREKFKNKQ